VQEFNLCDFEAVNAVEMFHQLLHDQESDRESILDHQRVCDHFLCNLIYSFVHCNMLKVVDKEPHNLVQFP
jgi:hypothetical protein